MTRSSDTAAHTHKWKISDVVLFPLLALGLALEWAWPTGFAIPGVPRWAIGSACFFGGFYLIHLAKASLESAGQPSLPGVRTTKLVTGGVFSYSRNPNYAGAMVVGIGLAVMFNSLWVLGATFLGGLILQEWMIRPEERFLSDTFGSEFAAYCASTRRWF